MTLFLQAVEMDLSRCTSADTRSTMSAIRDWELVAKFSVGTGTAGTGGRGTSGIRLASTSKKGVSRYRFMHRRPMIR